MFDSAQLQLNWSESPPLSFAHARVVVLDPESSVEHVAGWWHAHRALFEQLAREPAWETAQPLDVHQTR